MNYMQQENLRCPYCGKLTGKGMKLGRIHDTAKKQICHECGQVMLVRKKMVTVIEVRKNSNDYSI